MHWHSLEDTNPYFSVPFSRATDAVRDRRRDTERLGDLLNPRLSDLG